MQHWRKTLNSRTEENRLVIQIQTAPWRKLELLLYGKASLRQIPVLWLVLSRSGFCSTDRFHGNGPIRVFLFWSAAGKFKICNQNSEKEQ